ncbi:MAG: glycosyltransferase family 39 protein [Planctomycetota bacterium]
MASQIKNGDFSNYTGIRTPLYPLILALVGLDNNLVWVLQSILGIFITLLLFYIALNISGNALVSFITGLLYNLIYNQICFESDILPEAISIFLVILSVHIFIKMLAQEEFKNGWLIILGITSALAGLAKPYLALLPIVYVIFVMYFTSKKGATLSAIAKNSIILSLPLIILIGGWSTFNKIKLGYFGPTTLTGYNLTQHSGSFMELAPEKYSKIKAIYLKFRQKRIEETGSHSGTIWQAYPEMQTATGLPFGELSKVLTSMSLEMFAYHPLLYLKSVFKSWARFWSAPLYWRTENIRPYIFIPILKATGLAQRGALIFVNFIFLLIAVFYSYKLMFSRLDMPGTYLAIILLIIIFSIAQALVEYGENGRYSVSFQSLIIFIVISGVWRRFRPKNQIAK